MLPLRLEDATMTRRIIGLLVTLALVMSLAPIVAMAQLRGQIPQIRVLDPSPRQRPAPCLPAFQQGLRDLGYVEGQNLRIDYGHAEGQTSPKHPLHQRGNKSTVFRTGVSSCIAPQRGAKFSL